MNEGTKVKGEFQSFKVSEFQSFKVSKMQKGTKALRH